MGGSGAIERAQILMEGFGGGVDAAFLTSPPDCAL